MKPSKLYEALHALIGEPVPLHIWGAWGVGKSQIVSQVANDLDCDFSRCAGGATRSGRPPRTASNRRGSDEMGASEVSPDDRQRLLSLDELT